MMLYLLKISHTLTFVFRQHPQQLKFITQCPRTFKEYHPNYNLINEREKQYSLSTSEFEQDV